MSQGIQTIYAGDCFKSQLEVRWAIFFESLGLRYEYEKQSFGLLSGWYVPDFWLSQLKVWVEIKPRSGETADPIRYKELAYSSNHPLLCIMGKPEDGGYMVDLYAQRNEVKLRKATFAENPSRPKRLTLVEGRTCWEVRNGSRLYLRTNDGPVPDSIWLNRAMSDSARRFRCI
jgi:hypothetical protein